MCASSRKLVTNGKSGLFITASNTFLDHFGTENQSWSAQRAGENAVKMGMNGLLKLKIQSILNWTCGGQSANAGVVDGTKIIFSDLIEGCVYCPVFSYSYLPA